MPTSVAGNIDALPHTLIKRDGLEASFDKNRIEQALVKAGQATEEFNSLEAQLLTHQVLKVLNHRFDSTQMPDVERVMYISTISTCLPATALYGRYGPC